jgi:hypothetical protein
MVIVHKVCGIKKFVSLKKMGIEQMVGNFAERLFLGQQNGYKRLNCAQAIAEAFRQEYNFLTEDTVKGFKKMGHGKAPNGECGMLYAAKYIFEKNNLPDKAQEFEKHFRDFAGTTKCKELIKKKIPFCAHCINRTATFIDQK